MTKERCTRPKKPDPDQERRVVGHTERIGKEIRALIDAGFTERAQYFKIENLLQTQKEGKVKA